MTEPSPSSALASSSDFERLIGTPPAGLDIDALLDGASDEIRRVVEWHIGPSATQTFVVDGSGGRDLLLPTGKLTSVISVIDDGALVPLSDLQWSADGIIRRNSGTFTDRLRGVVATVEHGHPTVPARLVQLVCTIAARAGNSPSGQRRLQVGSVSEEFTFDLMVGETAYLDKFLLGDR